jgi:hypothetical protein
MLRKRIENRRPFIHSKYSELYPDSFRGLLRNPCVNTWLEDEDDESESESSSADNIESIDKDIFDGVKGSTASSRPIQPLGKRTSL